jgi:hypothetical protein
MLAMFVSGALVALAITSVRIGLGPAYAIWYVFWAWAFWWLGRRA